MDYEASKLFDLVSDKDFTPSDEKLARMKEDSYFNNHHLTKVPIDKLIKDNDLDNPISLSNRKELWGEDIHKYHYDPKQDKDYMYGTLRNGKIRIANGRHRIRALANDGYKNVWIPLLKE